MRLISKVNSFCAIIAVFLLVSQSRAQELEPLVDLDMSKLNADAKDRLSDFKQDIQSYLSKTKFTDEIIVNDVRGKPYKIRCSFNFIFNSATGFDSYEAQLVLTVQRNIYKTNNYTQTFRIKDESWDFNYLRGQTLYHDEQKFNNLTSYLDYYANLIIGLDDDSWEPKLGTARFQKAQNIVNLAVSSSSAKGWVEDNILKASRNTYVFELLNSKYEDFRRAFWIFHFSGIDSIQYGKRSALEKVAQAIEMIGKVKKKEVKSFVIKAFFDSKHMEIAQALTDHYDKSIYRKLVDIDPDHASTYVEYSKK